ncbi:MAG: hypothetical protein RL701_430 [Pseudomonadota bacterium]
MPRAAVFCIPPSWRTRILAFVASIGLLLPHTGRVLAQPEPAPSEAEGEPADRATDVMHAPPPEPEARPETPAPAPARKPKPKPVVKPASPPSVAAPKPSVGVGVEKEKAPPPRPVPALPKASPPKAPAAVVPGPPIEPAQSGVVPPPPTDEGDFAGQGAELPSEPQDDFDPDVQEYRQKEPAREYSVRFDLLNWLLLGRLAVELEVSLFKYLTVQLTPIFVTATSPIAVNYAGLDDPLRQYSHGLGPISGASVGVGAWLWGEPFRGYVLRLEFTNYGYSYRTRDSVGTIDRVDFTERRLILFVGSHSRFGPFTFSGGFGLGYELNQAERCFNAPALERGVIEARATGCNGKQWIALDRTGQERANLNGGLHPVYFQARFTVGIVF